MNMQAITANAADPETIDRLALDLTAGRTDTIAQVFSAQGVPAPFIVWNPLEPDAPPPVLRAFIRATQKSKNTDGRLTREFLNSDGYLILKDWTMELKPSVDLNDYTYVHYGREIANAYNRDMTGHSTSEFAEYLSTFYISVNRAVIARQEAVMTMHEPPKQVFVQSWRRVIVPVYDDDGSVFRIVIANVSDNELRAGLEMLPDAVLVTSPTGKLCYANRPAYTLFSQPRRVLEGVSVTDFTGIDLSLSSQPEFYVRQGKHETHRHVVLENGIVTPLEVSVSASFFRNEAFYIITARKI